jgi:hypothetical protein
VGIITVTTVAGMAGIVHISIMSIMAHAPWITLRVLVHARWRTLRGSMILFVTKLLYIHLNLLAVMMVAIAIRSAVKFLSCPVQKNPKSDVLDSFRSCMTLDGTFWVFD